jgi:hypothetical protein
VGVDTLGLDGRDCAEILDALAPGFERRDLRPFPVLEHAIYSLGAAKDAYAAVLSGARDRTVLKP